MKFSTGFLDGLFGKKTTIRVPQDDGTTIEAPVTEAWLKKMEAEGEISMSEVPSDTVPFYVIGPYGSETLRVQVGKDIPKAQYKKLADPQTGALFGLTFYENGIPKTSFVPRHMWEQALEGTVRAKELTDEFMKETMDQFKNL